MNKISFPIDQDTRGAPLTDLQDALLFFIDKNIIPLSDEDKSQASSRLREERLANQFGDVTNHLVTQFQKIFQLPLREDVDEPTAQEMNSRLLEAGMLSSCTQPMPQIVFGSVHNTNQQPLVNIKIRAVHADDQLGRINLGETVDDLQGDYMLRYDLVGGITQVNLYMMVLGERGEPLEKFEVKKPVKPLERVDLTVAEAEVTWVVHGIVLAPDQTGLADAQVVAIDKNIAGDIELGEG